MNDSLYDELIRLSLKHEITPEDRMRIEAVVAAHPELRDRWESDAAVSRLLRQLPDVPVSSNFTALVMEKIELDQRDSARSQNHPRFSLPQWLRPRLAAIFGLMIVGVLGVNEYRIRQDRSALAQNVRRVSQDLAALPPTIPGPEIFRDFDAIHTLRQVSVVSDDELLTVLQQ
jgi:anti-sigma factor RsiW